MHIGPFLPGVWLLPRRQSTRNRNADTADIYVGSGQHTYHGGYEDTYEYSHEDGHYHSHRRTDERVPDAALLLAGADGIRPRAAGTNPEWNNCRRLRSIQRDPARSPT